jgi:hypothetical protein
LQKMKESSSGSLPQRHMNKMEHQKEQGVCSQ